MQRLRAKKSLARWYFYNIPNKVARKLAFALPSKVAYWATIRLWAHATTGVYGNQTHYVMVDEVLRRWDEE